MTACSCSLPCGGTNCGGNTVEDHIKRLELDLLNAQHELALLMDKHMPKKWCCAFARSTNGWNHDCHCANYVVCY